MTTEKVRMKFCKGCDETKEINNFYKAGSKYVKNVII